MQLDTYRMRLSRQKKALALDRKPTISTPGQRAPLAAVGQSTGPIWLATGFRPFFLAAATLAAVWVPGWALLFGGFVDVTFAFPRIAWHGHEMLFGFASAAIAGFLLTAIQNWTKRKTAGGSWLALLMVLWSAGRLVMLIPGQPIFTAIVDLLFWVLLIPTIARPLIVTRNRRNYPFIALLMALAVINLSSHVANTAGRIETHQQLNYVALDLILIIIAIVAGRIIPLFTRNALADADRSKIRQRTRIDTLSLIALCIVATVDLCARQSIHLMSVVYFVAGVLHGFRLRGWGMLLVRKQPILWVLHLGYLWLAIGLLLRGASGYLPLLTSASIHTLTIGAIGTLILGMISRVALGHTGRPLRVTRRVATAYIVLQLSLLTRILPPLLDNALLQYGVMVSAACWSVSFLLYLVDYLPILIKPRLDGKPG